MTAVVILPEAEEAFEVLGVLFANNQTDSRQTRANASSFFFGCFRLETLSGSIGRKMLLVRTESSIGF